MRYYIVALAVIAALMISLSRNVHYYHITAGALAETGISFAEQSGMAVMYDFGPTERLRTSPVEGWHSSSTALDTMLQGTGYTWAREKDAYVVTGRSKMRPVSKREQL